ncbi:MAG: urea carboxylase [Cellvibrionaceae bacterium]
MSSKNNVKVFSKVLIANRGAIAVRIIRTLKKMGITSVAIYAKADADSLHVTQADEAYCLGDGSASETYLNQEKLFAIIKKSKADAIHPGYGFLSENPDFVERCESQHIVFIGPTAEQMRTFGLKHTARDIAQKNNVPLLLGTNLLLSLEEAETAAQRIGYPIILKSTAGGGGIGMQVCNDIEQLQHAFESVKRLSANNFSNDGVFIEKYILRARHIEVQVFGDGQGFAVALGERDCSAQRRHQKVLEETPAPNLPEKIRKELHNVAASLVAAVNYRNAGTVEFIYDAIEKSFYFLEVNTRLQVEHGVTEEVYGVDLVEWMLLQASNNLQDLQERASTLKPTGHSIQARVYAENPHKNFLPSAGLLSEVSFPSTINTQDFNQERVRIDHWISTGLEVSPFFDPMLGKVICTSHSREAAMALLKSTLSEIVIQGIETNIDYVQSILQSQIFQDGEIFTRYLNEFSYTPTTIDVISPGTMTTIQDYPGRKGYWSVGVPPSGAFDNYSFRIGQKLLNSFFADLHNDNDSNQSKESQAGLEITLSGPTLQFNSAVFFVLCGADIDATLDGDPITRWEIIHAKPKQMLKLGKVKEAGARTYLLFAGGLESNTYLDSKSTFTLGQFGGFSGRALRTGDVLHLENQHILEALPALNAETLNRSLNEATTHSASYRPEITNDWKINVIYGPHGAPDFFTNDDIENFFSATWKVHYNSSRTGIRLIGPKPEWARKTGGEAGMHPSNIHDNAYAIGSIDFTGDMPVILGPDGPSLGGFVCPATVITADLWKLGQLKAGDNIQFIPVTQSIAKQLEEKQLLSIRSTTKNTAQEEVTIDTAEEYAFSPQTTSPIFKKLASDTFGTDIIFRPAGDKYLLVEYGPLELDIRLRFRAHALMLWLQEEKIAGVLELTPGIRSLQIHYENFTITLEDLADKIIAAEQDLQHSQKLSVPSRIVHIPLSWDDEACRIAIEKYMQSVRKDAPWCPSNIEFIRRINGLDSIEEVKKIVFDANYVVMGLGDVYLGAPVATPLDPRHRLVTTKYNPARTWTAENSVGIGGSYLCVYGMEGPGGYQFIGRTLQMWNRYRTTKEFTQPWLLRFFDQIKFYEVSSEELLDIREKFPRGEYSLKIEETTFDLNEYQDFLDTNSNTISDFTAQRNIAFDEELQRWVDSGQINFEIEEDTEANKEQSPVPENCIGIESHIAGNIWQWKVSEGDNVEEGQVICVLESMKMEIEITSPEKGTLKSILKQQGQQISAGQLLTIIEPSI